MGGTIMIKNIIIIALLVMLYQSGLVDKQEVLAIVQSTLDFIQELVYDVTNKA